MSPPEYLFPKVGRSRHTGTGWVGDAVPQEVFRILEEVHISPLYVSSNLSRELAIAVAFAASSGWISNILPSGREYSRLWRITTEGLTVLRAHHMDATSDSTRKPT